MKPKVREGNMILLPPRPDHCQVCAAKHQAHEPHNAHSMYYQMKNAMEGKPTTWEDAMAHCSEEIKAVTRQALLENGVDTLKGELYPKKQTKGESHGS